MTKGAVHSEPKINSKRLFMGIIPGHKDDILDMVQAWRGRFEGELLDPSFIKLIFGFAGLSHFGQISINLDWWSGDSMFRIPPGSFCRGR